MSQPETCISNDIRLTLGKMARHVRLFRNHAGIFFTGHVKHQDGTNVSLVNAQRITGGLVEGAGDLAGWVSIIVTPDMVGKRIAVFAGPEVKVPGKHIIPGSPQEIWRDNVLRAGGLWGELHSPDEAIDLIRSAPGVPAT